MINFLNTPLVREYLEKLLNLKTHIYLQGHTPTDQYSSLCISFNLFTYTINFLNTPLV